jgi:hypothetical protein
MPKRILTDLDRLKIYNLFHNKNLKISAIAKEMGIKCSTVSANLMPFYTKDKETDGIKPNSFKSKDNDVSEAELFEPKFMKCTYDEVKDESSLIVDEYDLPHIENFAKFKKQIQ